MQKNKRENRQKKSRLNEDINLKKKVIIFLIVALLISPIIYLFTKNLLVSVITTLFLFAFSSVYVFFKAKLKRSEDIKKMENAFPDFLQLMSSNLRAGMTIDRALLLSSRKEFSPLDKEILQLGKDIVTGKKMESALTDMSIRIESEKINKIIALINSGIKSGGNLAVLLEETARNMKERNFVEKKAASNTLMYTIFIFFATGIGSPLLFALSSVLVEILTKVLSTLPDVQTTANLPFTLTSITVSTTFIIYFSVAFIIAIDILGSLILGLVHKGEEKAGIRYIIPLILVGLLVFFIVRITLSSYFTDFFS